MLDLKLTTKSQIDIRLHLFMVNIYFKKKLHFGLSQFDFLPGNC